MLAKVCLKRFRFVLYAALFFLITLHITDRTNSGLIATICIWFALPLAFIAFVWWIYACIRDIVRFFKSGAVPEDAPTWAERAVWWVQDELAEIASLDDRGKVRFFLFRVGGVALAALGLVLIVRDSIASAGHDACSSAGWRCASPPRRRASTATARISKCWPVPKE